MNIKTTGQTKKQKKNTFTFKKNTHIEENPPQQK